MHQGLRPDYKPHLQADRPRVRRQRVVIKRSDMVKFIRWLTENQKTLDQEKFSLREAWIRSTKAIGIPCSYESFRRLIRDSGIHWEGPKKQMGKISGDKYRFLAQCVKKMANKQKEIIAILNELGYKIEGQDINFEALHLFTRGQSWKDIKDEIKGEFEDDDEEEPLNPKE